MDHQGSPPVFLIITDFLIFLSVFEREVLKYPAVIVDLYFSLFSFVKFCFVCFEFLILCSHLRLSY